MTTLQAEGRDMHGDGWFRLRAALWRDAAAGRNLPFADFLPPTLNVCNAVGSWLRNSGRFKPRSHTPSYRARSACLVPNAQVNRRPRWTAS